MSFAYILDKIREAEWSDEPFRHIEIKELLSPEHFQAIVSAPEIALAPSANDAELFDRLLGLDYKIVAFPGCITDRHAYMAWHANKSAGHGFSNTSCEGFGITLRLMGASTPIIAELRSFLGSKAFWVTLIRKLGVPAHEMAIDVGIQKYLDGYEISPHPDVRRKALTFMVNINPAPQSEAIDHHTHYLRFRPDYRYVRSYWRGNPDKDRCWVPWDWCETMKQQTANNSMVLFAPDDHSMHAVKATYDHLHHQRTQLYGNLWSVDFPLLPTPAWENFVVGESPQQLRTNPHTQDDAVIPNRLQAQPTAR